MMYSHLQTFNTDITSKIKLIKLWLFWAFIPNYISLFHQKLNTTKFETQWHLKASVSLLFQYLVCPPFLLMTAWMRIFLGDFSKPNFLDVLPQGLSAWWLLVCHLILNNSPQVLDWIEIWTVPAWRSCFSSVTQWLPLIGDMEHHLAWKTMQPWICKCSFSFSLSYSMYLSPFIVVFDVMKYRPAAPQHNMASQIIWLSRCFIGATTYFLSKRVLNGHLMCMWWGTNCCMVHSSENNTFSPLSESPMAMMSDKVQSLFSSSLVSGVAFMLACRTSVKILCWDVLKTVLELKCKIARFSCRSSLMNTLPSAHCAVFPCV